MRMKGKSLIILIVAVVLIAAGTGIAAAYLLDGGGSGFVLETDGTPVEENLNIEGLYPGQSKTVEHSVRLTGEAEYSLSLTLGEENALTESLDVAVTVAGKEIFSGKAAQLAESGASCGVSGDFEFSVTYSLAETAGNEAQGKRAELKIEYSLKGGERA